MSGAIEKLTAALEANTAALNAIIASGGGKPAAARPTEKPAAAAAKPAAKPAGKKKTTVDDIANAFGEYLKIKDKDERDARKANVKAIVDYFGAAKATEIDADNFDEALRYLQQYIDGETPDFDGAGGGEEEGDLV
jgi:hypothetical protein